ncbi:MAG: hypothetical protein M1834_005436 [Cirrosporium novae-zelandiae]|nr:MAG: hypothetical protein M1834_005436 [Cirrosporium novae-zelandiae]
MLKSDKQQKIEQTRCRLDECSRVLTNRPRHPSSTDRRSKHDSDYGSPFEDYQPLYQPNFGLGQVENSSRELNDLQTEEPSVLEDYRPLCEPNIERGQFGKVCEELTDRPTPTVQQSQGEAAVRAVAVMFYSGSKDGKS